MEPIRDDELLNALEALRPTPRPAFAAELDARVAAGFPRRSRLAGLSPTAVIDRVRGLKPRQILLPVGATAVTAVVIATVAISFSGSDQSNTTDGQISFGAAGGGAQSQSPREGTDQAAAGGSSAGVAQYGAEIPEVGRVGGGNPQSASSAASGVERHSGALSFDGSAGADFRNRAVERSAEITLGTDPAEVGEASSEVFDVVHTYRGVVLRSQTSDGSAGRAAADFELLIPSAKLGDAMAAFSRIAEVRSRHEATADITAPTVGATEHLEDSQARIDGLLIQLAAATAEGEREAVEAELRGERRRAAGLRVQLQNLERRANLSRVSLHIESGEAVAAPNEGGAWGVADALEDAGRILAVAAAVLLVALAILAPILLLALLAWLAHRTCLRRARHQALS